MTEDSVTLCGKVSVPRSMTRGGTPVLLLPAAVLRAALGGYWLAQQLDRTGPRLTSGSWLPQPKAVGDFLLTDTLGRTFTRASLAGEPSLVFFGFTHCPDVCPATLLKLAQARKAPEVAAVRVVLVSVDPQRDTPTALGMYVHAFGPTFLGLTGDTQSIGRMAADFNVAVSRVELPGGAYTMDHSEVVFLLHAGARIVAVFTPPFEVRSFAADLRRAAPYLASGMRSPHERPGNGTNVSGLPRRRRVRYPLRAQLRTHFKQGRSRG